MRVCIKDDIFCPSFISLYGEEKAIEQGYTIFEVPKGYEDCAFSDFDNNGFNVELYNKRKQGYANHKKIAELKNWFDNYFDEQFKQSQWQKNFKVNEDPYFKDENGNPRTYADIEELKAQAELVRETINSLRDEV